MKLWMQVNFPFFHLNKKKKKKRWLLAVFSSVKASPSTGVLICLTIESPEALVKK